MMEPEFQHGTRAFRRQQGMMTTFTGVLILVLLTLQ